MSRRTVGYHALAGSDSNDETEIRNCRQQDCGQTGHDKNKDLTLRREIGVFSGTCLVIATMIGSGIFIVPTGVLKYSQGDVVFCLIGWVCGGIVTLILALCLCELGTTFPQSGSYLNYLHKLYGPMWSFIYTWMLVAIANPEGNAAQMIAFGEYVLRLYFAGRECSWSNEETVARLIGLSVTFVIMYINIRSVKLAVRLQIVCAFGKVAALVLITVVGIIYFIKHPEIGKNNFESSQLVQSWQHKIPSAHLSFANISLAIYQSLWAYDGAEIITCITEEVKNPRKTLPLVTLLAVIIVTVLYVFVNISYFAVLSPSEILASNAVAVSFGHKVHPLLPHIMTFFVCLSLVGSLNGSFLVAGRMPYVAAKFGHMPKIFSMIHVEHVSPSPAILFVMIMSLCMVESSGIDSLITGNLLVQWAFRCFCLFGLIKLRRNKTIERPYKVSMATVVVAILMSTYLSLVPLILNPQVLYFLTLGVVIFLALSYFIVKRIKNVPFYEEFSAVCQKLLLVAPTLNAT